MLALTLAGFGIALVTGSDRFLLAKESLLTALVGFWFLGSLRAPRPLSYEFTRPILERSWGKRLGLPDVSWEAVWARELRFRRILRVSTVMWGIATLTDAVLRVVIAYSVPVDAVIAVQTAMFVVTIAAMQPITHIYYARAGLWRLLWQANR